MRKKYKNPPIVEALCELTFDLPDDTSINLVTLPGLLQTRLGEAYSGKPREQRVHNVTLPAKSKNEPIQIQGETFRYQLPNEDNTRVLSIGPVTLAVNMLKPYGDEGWEGEFLPRIREALEAYLAVAKPQALTRIGVRYINQIEIPGSVTEIGTYFNLNKLDAENNLDECRLTAFWKRLEYKSNDEVKVLLTYATVNPSQPENSAFLVDIDTVWDQVIPPVDTKIIEKIELLHTRGGSIFEQIITNKTRELFDA